MPVCSYVVVPRSGAMREAAAALGAIAGCEVHPAKNADILLLLTETDSFEEDVALRDRIESVESVQALLLTFGEIDPETPVGDPVREARP